MPAIVAVGADFSTGAVASAEPSAVNGCPLYRIGSGRHAVFSRPLRRRLIRAARSGVAMQVQNSSAPRLRSGDLFHAIAPP